ncbi:MAG: tetratricopeptide repeat protein, partial [Okeania sp. SIO3B3]|nr:tetratricopeptide repeat protein [Okeania sp. SIO3B3]
MENTKRRGAALNRANQLKHEGNLERALANYREALEFNPYSFWCHYNMGDILARQGKDKEAMISYGHALEIEPNHAWSHHCFGKTLARMGKSAEAIVSQQRAIKLQPDLCWAYYSLGSIFFQQGNLDEALAAFYQAIQLQPGVAAFHKSLAEVLSSLERNSEAAKAYFEAGEKFTKQNFLSEAVNAYRQAILLNGGLSECYKKLGEALAAQGNFETAIDAYQEGINLNEKDGELYGSLGVALAVLGRLEEAVSVYNRAAEILNSQPTDANYSRLATIYHNQGEGLEGLGKKPAAMTAYQLALEIDSNRGVTRLKLGILLAKDRQLESALDCYQKAIVSSLEEIKDCQELKILLKILARQDYGQQVILSHREMKPSQSIVGLYYKLALILAELDRLDEAVICFQEASQLLSQITPKHSPTWQFSKHPSTEEEIYENLWQALNQPNLEILDEISDSYPHEIDFDRAFTYFNKTGEYRVIKIFYLKEEDREFLAEKGLSFDLLQFIWDDRNSQLEKTYIHNFDPEKTKKLSPKRNLRGWQHSILETGCIYLVSPKSGSILSSSQSFYVNLGMSRNLDIFVAYRFLDKEESFYLFTPLWSYRGSKIWLYFPLHDLIVSYSDLIKDNLIPGCITVFKSYFVSYWDLVKSYLQNENKKKISSVSGCIPNIGHYFLDYLPEFHNLFELYKLHKIDLFLIGIYTWIKINEVYPE